MRPYHKLLESIDQIPAELRDRDQWVGYKIEVRDGRQTKVPYSPLTNERASTTDALTWATFDEALLGLELFAFDGIGFVFSSGDPFAGIDLDNCRDPETEEIDEWAQGIMNALDGYAEVSPSGTGVHVIVKGKAPNKKCGNVEAYSSERYFTVTGDVL